MTIKKTAFVFCILCLVFCSCSLSNQTLEYTFDNKSSYTIRITLAEPYKTNKDDEENRTSPFSVYSLNVTNVYVQSNGSVDFQWTTNSAQDNPKVYCVTNGPKATFKNR
ncbi:hypothetical protein [Treponema sp. R80B11-R83G3]